MGQYDEGIGNTRNTPETPYDEEGIYSMPVPDIYARMSNPPTLCAVARGIMWMHVKLLIFPLAAIIMGVVAWVTKASDPAGKECSTNESDNCGFLRVCRSGKNPDSQQLCTPNLVFYGIVFIPSFILFLYVILAILIGNPKRKGMIQAVGNSLWLHWGFPFYAFIALMWTNWYGHEVWASVIVMWWSLFCSLSGVYLGSADPNNPGFPLKFWLDHERSKPSEWLASKDVLCLKGTAEGCSCLPGRCKGFSNNLESQDWFHVMPYDLLQFNITKAEWSEWMRSLRAVQDSHNLCDGVRFINFCCCIPFVPPCPWWFFCMLVLPLSRMDPFQRSMKKWLLKVNIALYSRGSFCKILTFAETNASGDYWKDGSMSMLIFALNENGVKRLEQEPVLQQGNSGDPNWGCWGTTAHEGRVV